MEFVASLFILPTLLIPHHPMKSSRISSLLLTGILLLGPLPALAGGRPTPVVLPATASDAVTEDILNVLETDTTEPAAMPTVDGRGGGGGVGMIYPSAGGIQVEASVTREVTPDFVALNVYCEIVRKDNRQQIVDAMNQLYTDIKNAVGKDGRVRRSGGVSVFPYYDATGQASSQLSGNMNLFIKFTNTDATGRIYDYIESKGCTPNWDVRLVDTLSFESKILDQLVSRLNKRKSIFEKLLGKRLTRVLSASLNTWVDGYATYDPDTNKADATATLSVTFDPGTRATIPTR